MVLTVCCLSLAAGYALKLQCTQIPWDGSQYGRLCYNDLQALFEVRGIDEGVFPYVEGDLVDGELTGGAIEYPVLTGVFMWATGALAKDWKSYLSVSALFLAPFGLLTAWLALKMAGRRALLFAAAPAVVLYAFHNWDLLVVAAVALGMWLWTKGRPGAAGVAFGLGAALKLYPLFFLAPLVMERLVGRDKKGAAATAGAGLGTLVAVNLPFALANFDGWWATYEFHRLRVADFNSIYTWGFESVALDPSRLNLVTAVLTLASFVAAIVWGLRRARTSGCYPFVGVAGAMLAAFMLWSKVHSPQYALWILLFFVLLEVHIGWWVAYALADLAVYVGIFRWFYDFSRTQDIEAWTFAKGMLVAGVWGRAALLAGLFVVFLRARPAVGVEPATGEVSQARSNLDARVALQ